MVQSGVRPLGLISMVPKPNQCFLIFGDGDIFRFCGTCPISLRE
uniref:Uncharacterized protein n=1 Tax=Rhizophora mucronata TaxID=61149 RepID=A0A2P2KT73_RHIMU